ncbi:unnamed protein product [Porites lobata]|uniref:Securin n=1 Tax=Porites lobata TaxID=104759 RepID=A0ABN8P323_9CNID|nr:unnamed protein product [Porites lobata]
MATETAFRPHIDQENAQAVNIKGGNVSGRSFGIAKSFQSNHTSLATPRRALGDVQNTLQAGTTKARKGLALRPNKPCGKTPGATKVLQGRTGTPATKGLPLLQQISSAGLKQSTKQKHTSHARTKEKQKVKAQQQELCEKEVMYPFTEQEDVLPRSKYVSTILKNVGALYHGCMFQPHSALDSEPKEITETNIHFENERRPAKDSYLDSLPFEGELDSLTQGLTTLSLPDIELPPVDIDSLGLGIF